MFENKILEKFVSSKFISSMYRVFLKLYIIFCQTRYQTKVNVPIKTTTFLVVRSCYKNVQYENTKSSINMHLDITWEKKPDRPCTIWRKTIQEE